MSKNSLAKKAGVPTGISYRQAREICPGLVYVKADMSKYLATTKSVRAIYNKYSEKVIHYGMDESWIDLGYVSYREAEQIADLIRIEIMYTLSLSASLGVSYNLIFSKIGSDYRKPNAVTVITLDNYKKIVWPLPSSKLLFVGAHRKYQLLGRGISTIGDIAHTDPFMLSKLLGKAGYDLWQYANGNDNGFKPNAEQIGSIGNTITPPANLHTTHDVSAILYLLATAVCTRLKKHKLKTSCISISMRDQSFNKTTRQCTFITATDSVNYVFNNAYKLFVDHYEWKEPLRSIGVRADKLDSLGQLTLIEWDDCKPIVDVSSRVIDLTNRLGPLNVEQAATTKEMVVSADDIKP